MAHDVFISHAVEDRDWAERVRRALEDAGLRCWIAPRDIPPGRDYEEAIVEAIAASPVLVLVLSDHSNRSAHVKREVQHAFAEGSPTRVIPFRVEPVNFSKSLSYYLGSVQWIDAFAAPPEEPLARLVRQARAELAAPAGAATADEAVAVAYTVPKHASRAPLWIGVAAVGLLLVAAAGYFAFKPGGGRGGRQVNANVTPATPTPAATPSPTRTPTPTATPTPSPTRTPVRNLNLRVPNNLRPINLNLNRARPQG